MKRKALNLSDLKVKSFVTAFTNEKENTIKGGGSVYCFPSVKTEDYGEGCKVK